MKKFMTKLMFSPRICSTFIAIATVTMTLPAIALPTTTEPTTTKPTTTVPPTSKPKPTAISTTAIRINEIAGVYKAIFNPKWLQSIPDAERQSLDPQKTMLESIRLTVKPDNTFELISRESPQDPTIKTIVGKVKIENDKVSLTVDRVNGKAVTTDQSKYPPAVFSLLERGKVWELPDNQRIKLVQM